MDAFLQDAWAVCRIFKKCTLAQRHTPPLSQWTTTQPQQVLADATAQNFVLPVPFRGSESASNPDLEHDSSSQERSDTTSEELEVECTPQGPQQNYVQQRGFATAAPHLQQPQTQEQSASTAWISTMSRGMGDFPQGTSSARSNMIVRQRTHIPGEMNPLEMGPNNLFVQNPPPMRGALEYGSCIIINPPDQSGTQFVDRNFDSCNNRSRESLNLTHHQSQPIDNFGPGSVGPRMNSSLSLFRNDLAQQIPQQLPHHQPFFSTQPWD